MKRLTEPGYKWDENSIFREIDSWSLAECLNRLSAYEDTELEPEKVQGKIDACEVYKSIGLTPDQIIALRERDATKEPRVHVNNEDVKIGAILFKKGIKVYRCPVCNRLLIYGDKFCRDCGQHLKWAVQMR